MSDADGGVRLGGALNVHVIGAEGTSEVQRQAGSCGERVKLIGERNGHGREA